MFNHLHVPHEVKVFTTGKKALTGVNTPGSDENRLKFYVLMYILVHVAVAPKTGDVAASFDSAVHRVHAVSFDAAVASIVSAACCVAAGYFVCCCCLLCSCCSSILLPQEDLSRNLELTESTPSGLMHHNKPQNLPLHQVASILVHHINYSLNFEKPLLAPHPTHTSDSSELMR
ncbi:hypothetical protein Tco_1216627 [Tanacetum coccineum]